MNHRCVTRPPAGGSSRSHRIVSLCAAMAAGCAFMSAPCLAADGAEAPDERTLSSVDHIFEDYALDSHIPGMVYGVVSNGKLVHVRGIGVQDLESKRPVTADTLFRIASMTKAFTALTVLTLRDQGKLRLDEPVEAYVPELRGWKYPTLDSPRIRVRDLLNHTAGFVTDDPWGDRQTPLPEADFSRMLREGIPFARTPETGMEYSNLGFALLGRIISNVSGHPYAETIAGTLLKPLGMQSSGFFVDAAPRERRALGYRWEDDAWRLEPTLAHGAFGAMGGIQTSANDYAKWVAFLLSAWPPRDDTDGGPAKRATVRELAQGSNSPQRLSRPGHTGSESCRQAGTYGMGLWVAIDCDLGLTLRHGGGYPGYGSHVLLLPEYGVGIFALANRTYAGPSGPGWDAAMTLQKAGFFKAHALPVSHDLEAGYRTAGDIYRRGALLGSENMLAMNFLMDRDAAGWSRDLAGLKRALGDCNTTAAPTESSDLAGTFVWRCEHGRLAGSLTLAPTSPPRIQQLVLTRKDP